MANDGAYFLVVQKVKSLFPDNMQPFSAGFGNTETDWKSYKAVGIGDIKVFHTVKVILLGCCRVLDCEYFMSKVIGEGHE